MSEAKELALGILIGAMVTTVLVGTAAKFAYESAKHPHPRPHPIFNSLTCDADILTPQPAELWQCPAL